MTPDMSRTLGLDYKEMLTYKQQAWAQGKRGARAQAVYLKITQLK